LHKVEWLSPFFLFLLCTSLIVLFIRHFCLLSFQSCENMQKSIWNSGDIGLLALCICLSHSHILPFELVVCKYSIVSMKSGAQILLCLIP
jgi:hypothetical protein